MPDSEDRLKGTEETINNTFDDAIVDCGQAWRVVLLELEAIRLLLHKQNRCVFADVARRLAESKAKERGGQ